MNQLNVTLVAPLPNNHYFKILKQLQTADTPISPEAKNTLIGSSVLTIQKLVEYALQAGKVDQNKQPSVATLINQLQKMP